jgi:hypothetical protein
MPAKKTNVARMPKTATDDYGSHIHGLAKELSAAIDGVAEQLGPIYHVEVIADNLGSIASALSGLANAVALQTIARNGDEEDRAKAVAKLKGWFDEFKD